MKIERWIFLLALFFAGKMVHAQSIPSVAGIYSGEETAVLTMTAGGETERDTIRGTNPRVVLSQTGNVFSFTVTDPSSGVSVTRTFTLAGNNIVSGTGPAAGIRPTPGLTISQNQITSASGTVSQGRIDLVVRGRIVGVADGESFTIDVSSTVVLIGNVSPTNTPPTISVQPVGRTVSSGGAVNFGVTAAGTPPLTYQWRKDGVDIPGATNPVFSITRVEASHAGGYSVVVTNSFGEATSSTATLTVTAAPSAPAITIEPRNVLARYGSTVALTVAASGTAPLVYQWRKNGAPIPGASRATLVLNSASSFDAASYSAVVTNAMGSSSSRAATVSVVDSSVVVAPSRLANLSVRSTAGVGEATLIVGFVIGGSGPRGSKQILIRGIGPALADFGVSGAIDDPRLTLYDGNTAMAANDDWGGDSQITAVGAQVGAFALAPSTSKDAAIYRAAQPAGAFSVQLSGAGATTGVALAEIYDATPTSALGATTPRLVNVSARTRAGGGSDTLIAGFVIDGPNAQTVLIRAIGPALAGFGVPGWLSDPKLELYQGATNVGENDDWDRAPGVAAIAGRVGAFTLPNVSSRDSVLLISLAPGAYTAHVSGVGGTTGIALVEVYEVP